MGRYRAQLDPVKVHESFTNARSDYDSARASRFKRTRRGVSGGSKTGDYHLRSEYEYFYMMEAAREAARNDVVIPQGIRRLANSIFREGINPDPQTGDNDADAFLTDLWGSWSTNRDAVDMQQELDFHEFVKVVFRSVVIDGDICVLPLTNGRLQAIEGHRLRTPSRTTRNVVYGVLLDDQRQRLEYWFTKDDIDPFTPLSRVGDMDRVRARDTNGNRQVYHIYRPDRFTLTRGVSQLNPIGNTHAMHDDIQFAQMVRQQVASCFAILRERPLMADTEGETGDRGDKYTEDLYGGGSRLVEGISPGMEVMGEPGEKITGFSAAVPNNEFFQHAMMMLSFIAVNLDLPVQVLLIDPSLTNFSGWRGAMEQAREGFSAIQTWMINFLHKEVWQWKVREWIAENRDLQTLAAKPGVDLFRHRWNRPKFPYIEPLKDASADLLRQRNMLTSPRRLQNERSQDWYEIVDETVVDNGYAIRAAKREAAKINKEFQDDHPVHWREVVSLPTPDGVSVNADATEPQGQGQRNHADQN